METSYQGEARADGAHARPPAAEEEQPRVGDARFEDLAHAVFRMMPGVDGGGELLRAEAAELLDGLLVRVVRGQGALDLAMGRDLEALSKGKMLSRLGYVRLGDYAR
ncbi:MAG: hypothetical protein ACOC0J_02445, partial [Myxococcota bacterium]